MKLSSWAPCILIIGILACPVTASPIVWVLPDTPLQGCCVPPLSTQTALLSGAFVFDADTLTYLDWNFTISGYVAPLEPMNGQVTPSTSDIVVGNPTFLHLNYGPARQADLVLTFGFITIGGVMAVPLPPNGGSVPFLMTNSARFESFFATSNGIASSIPEPMAGVLVLLGAAVLCLVQRGRRAQV